MKNYLVVKDFSPDLLAKKVNRYLEIGYVITGGLVVVDDWWYQAVVLPK